MRISLITVARNARDTIGATMMSVSNQTLAPYEHLLIDGASTDDTVAAARAAATHPLQVSSEPDRGLYDAMNKGFARATGEVVGLINADDMLFDESILARVSATLQAHPEAVGCYADLLYVDRDDPRRIIRYWRSGAHRPGAFARGWVPPHPTLYLRREIFAQLGPFDLSYRLAADFEFMLRLFVVHGLGLVHVPEVWVRMRLGGATSRDWRSILAGNREIARALREHCIGWPPFTQSCRMLRRIPQFVSRRL